MALDFEVEDEEEKGEEWKAKGKFGRVVAVESRASREAQNKPARDDVRDRHRVRRDEGMEVEEELLRKMKEGWSGERDGDEGQFGTYSLKSHNTFVGIEILLRAGNFVSAAWLATKEEGKVYLPMHPFHLWCQPLTQEAALTLFHFEILSS